MAESEFTEFATSAVVIHPVQGLLESSFYDLRTLFTNLNEDFVWQ